MQVKKKLVSIVNKKKVCKKNNPKMDHKKIYFNCFFFSFINQQNIFKLSTVYSIVENILVFL